MVENYERREEERSVAHLKLFSLYFKTFPIKAVDVNEVCRKAV
jgi:hypothetical protein